MKIRAAYIEITNICNLNCCTCYNRSGVPHKEKELSIHDFNAIMDRLVNEFGCKRICLSGGEPTLHSQFSEILHLLITRYSELEINIVTNGTTRSDQLVKVFNRNKNIMLQVSLDGSNEDVNSRTRGEGNFHKTLRLFSQLSDVTRVLVKMVISLNNLSDIEPFYEFVTSMGYIPEFDFVEDLGNAREAWQTLGLTAQQKLCVLRLINDLNRKHDIITTLPYCTSSCPLTHQDVEHYVLIKTTGDVFPCQMLYGEKYRLGNMLSDDTDIFENSMANVFKIAKKRMSIDYGCGNCLAKSSCNKGCMAHAEIMNGDPLTNDDECEFRKLQLVGFHALRR